MGKLGIYCRQSRAKETDSSIEDQIRHGLESAQKLNMEHILYIDRDSSAMVETLDNRPQMVKLLSDISSGIITAVFAIEESRLVRNNLVRQQIKRVLKENKIRVYTLLDGVVDYTNSDHVFTGDLKALMGEKFVNDGTAKMKSILRARAAEGKAHHGIFKPFGYMADADKKLVLHPEESIIVKEIFNHAFSGMGSTTIAKILNDRNVFTRGRSLPNGIMKVNKHTKEIRHIPSSSFRWVSKTILGILKNSIYKGERIYLGEVMPAPAIVDPFIWEKIQDGLKARTNKRVCTHEYLLNDMCKCGRCGNRMLGKTRVSKRDHYYYCTSRLSKGNECKIRSINIDYLNEIVWYACANSTMITQFALEEVNKEKECGKVDKLLLEKDALAQELKTNQSALSNIQQMVIRDLMSIDDAETEIVSYNANIKRCNDRMELIGYKLNDYQALVEAIDECQIFRDKLSELLHTASYNLKKQIIKLYVDSVTVNYDDDSQMYTIDLLVNIGKEKDIHSFYLKQGDCPNLIDYAPEKDRYYQNYLKKSKDREPLQMKNFALPPQATPPPMLPLSEAVLTPSQAKSRWRTTAYFF